MKERPIIFSLAMVLAILDGQKSQTWRIVKPQPNENHKKVSKCYSLTLGRVCAESTGCAMFQDENGLGYEVRCPYGVAGDRLWVRETFVVDHYEYIPHGKMPKERPGFILDEHIYYRATCDGIPEYEGVIPWRPSIHMPRWASRITLEITKVRVERLQDISARNCIAEGIDYEQHKCTCEYCHMHPSEICPATSSSLVMEYAELWDSLHGKGAWEKNPWVWVLEFNRVTN